MAEHQVKLASTVLKQPAVVASPSPHPPSLKRKLADGGNSGSEGEIDASQGSVGESSKVLSKLEKGKAKKRRKEEQRSMENPPSFAFDTRGFKGGRMVKITDVRDLILHLMANDKAQSWLLNKSNLRRVVCVMAPGILTTDLGIPQPPLSANIPFPLAPSADLVSKLPVFQTLFSHACPTKAPGEKNRMHSPYQHFTTCPMTGAEKDRRQKARKERGQQQKTSNPSVYLLSPYDMAEQAYPTPSPLPSPLPTDPIPTLSFEDWQKADGWVEAPYQPEREGPKRVLGMDCEMCLTDDGSELTRLSVVDLEGNSVYDKLVKPDKPIRDYLTRFSGMTAEKLEGVTTCLVDVQRELTQIMDYNTILVGHSLECDLKVLKLVHSRVIDTSVIYQHPRGPPFKASLKWLAQKWLKKDIQMQGTGVDGQPVVGHDSQEDARTAIELLKLKMEKGPGFGEMTIDQETIFERIGRGQDAKTSAVVDHGTPMQWIGAKATTAVACKNDDEVLQGLLDSVEQHDLTVGRFMDLSHTLGWTQPFSQRGRNANEGEASNGDSASRNSFSSNDIGNAYTALNKRLQALHAALPPLTALIVFTGHSSPLEMSRLTAKKANFDRLWKTIKQSEIRDEDRWMEHDDRQLLEEVEKCRWGLSFFCVK
ncbi:RNA exonuclease 1 [Rhodotorula toruloides]|uniref:RNA exonuclease 1 n=1 Tax=Rhodotorula toruloides TaxID=5286 RepID=A0A511KG12_RHOTO|nr:RNA exonuclease 1 [Rhodotorula toruloides]